MNFRFTNKELKNLQFFASGTENVFCHPEAFTGLKYGERKSLIKLLADLTSKPGARDVQEEQILFDLSDRRSNWYRSISMVERIRLLYSSVNSPFPRLYNNRSKKSVLTLVKYVKLISEWYTLYSEGRAEKIAKFLSVSMFNKVMNVEPLESIDLPFGWCVNSLTPWGAMHRRVIRRLRKSSLGEKLRLAQCFLYFKKGCPKASPDFILDSLKKHKVALTSPAPPLDMLTLKCENATVVMPRAGLISRVREVVYSVFKDYKEPLYWWDPSRSASYHSSSISGGQFNETSYSVPGWTNVLTDKGVQFLPRGEDNWEYHDTGNSFVKVPIVVHPVIKPTERILARPVAITEPLKVRVITCENAWSTFALAGAQKSLWDCLHKHPWFALTGRPASVSDIPVSDLEWISVDYSAATDNLSKEFSRLVIREICDLTGLPFQLCFDSLCNHLISYEESGDSKAEEVEQSNGQLMGSILSFVVLCICNATVISLSINPERFAIEDPILVNGDDGLFVGGDKEYAIWKMIASHVGLTPSIGKVYKSRDFCVINSQCYYRNADGLVRECLYPNASGMMQFDARTSSRPKYALDMADSLKLWLGGFVDSGDRDAAEKLWYSTFHRILTYGWVSQFSVDWYLPKSLGGLGLPISESTKDRVVGRVAFARARWCLENGPIFGAVHKPLPGEASLNNPFMEDNTWSKVNWLRQPSREDELALSHLGFSKHAEVVERVKPAGFDYDEYLKTRSSNLSALALASLNNVDLITSGKVLRKRIYDMKKCRLLYEDPALQHYWEGYREVHARNFQFLEVQTGSRKIIPWKPRIPNYDLIHGRNYARMLEIVHSVRGLCC